MATRFLPDAATQSVTSLARSTVCGPSIRIASRSPAIKVEEIGDHDGIGRTAVPSGSTDRGGSVTIVS
jgi:hypothetical protein